jgi:hypothetical protein
MAGRHEPPGPEPSANVSRMRHVRPRFPSLPESASPPRRPPGPSGDPPRRSMCPQARWGPRRARHQPTRRVERGQATARCGAVRAAGCFSDERCRRPPQSARGSSSMRCSAHPSRCASAPTTAPADIGGVSGQLTARTFSERSRPRPVSGEREACRRTPRPRARRRGAGGAACRRPGRRRPRRNDR